MKKNLFLALGLSLGLGMNSFAQQAEVAPFVPNGSYEVEDTNALFDLIFNYDLTMEIGQNGNAGVIYINGEYWVSAWASDVINVLDSDGIFVESFTIPGITGVRSFTTDGEFVYAGTASTKIFKIDPFMRTNEGSINISPTTDAAARMVAYDPTLDGGAGGFWCGSFSSSIEAFSMSGSSLHVIPASNFPGEAIYGGAVDNISPDGPFLWIFSQKDGTKADVVQISLTTDMPTGVVYDYNTSGDQPAGNTSIAGGLFIDNGNIVADKAIIIGVGQGTPNDQLFGIELAGVLGVSNQELTQLSVYPNPVVNGVLNIVSKTPGVKQVSVYDMTGNQVLKTVVNGQQLNVSSLRAGTYIISITQEGKTVNKKILVK